MSPRQKLIALAALACVAFVVWRIGRPAPQLNPAPEVRTNSSAPATSPSATPERGSTGINPAPAGESAPESLAARLAKVSGDSVQQQTQLDQIAASIPDADLEKTLDLIWEEGSPAARTLRAMLLRRWAAAHPEIAASWLDHKGETPERRELAVSLATVWANNNAADAVSWVRQWPAEQREPGMIAVGYEVARKTPESALWIASELPPGEARNQLIKHAVSQWAATDAESSSAWAAKMEPSPLRDEVVANLSLALSETDPQGAARLAIESLPQGRTQSDVVVGIVQRWVQNEPEKAAEWVAAFPEGELRDISLENMILLWSDKAPADAAEWLNNIEHGPDRDIGVAALARKLAGSDPAAAAEWVQSMTNEDRRRESAESLAERWLVINPEAAREWLGTAPIPEERKAALLAEATQQSQKLAEPESAAENPPK